MLAEYRIFYKEDSINKSMLMEHFTEVTEWKETERFYFGITPMNLNVL